MAELNTTDGLPFYFDPSSVTAIADHDEDSGEAVTLVYGLTSQGLRLREGAAAFLARIGGTKKFAKLTRLDGSPVWVNGAAVTVIRPPFQNEYSPAANAVIPIGALTQAVQETPAQVRHLVNACGAKL